MPVEDRHPTIWSDIEAALNSVKDPQDTVMPSRSGLIDQGLVDGIEMEVGEVTVRLRLRTQSSLRDGSLVDQISERVGSVPGVTKVAVTHARVS